MTEQEQPSRRQLDCGYCLYGPPAICTCGECVPDEARVDRSRAQMADRDVKRILRGLLEYIEWHGPLHDDDCPGDDTCGCSGKDANDGANGAVRILSEIERLQDQARAISVLLSDAGIGPCTLPEGVRQLVALLADLSGALHEKEQELKALHARVDAMGDGTHSPTAMGKRAD